MKILAKSLPPAGTLLANQSRMQVRSTILLAFFLAAVASPALAETVTVGAFEVTEQDGQLSLIHRTPDNIRTVATRQGGGAGRILVTTMPDAPRDPVTVRSDGKGGLLHFRPGKTVHTSERRASRSYGNAEHVVHGNMVKVRRNDGAALLFASFQNDGARTLVLTDPGNATAVLTRDGTVSISTGNQVHKFSIGPQKKLKSLVLKRIEPGKTSLGRGRAQPQYSRRGTASRGRMAAPNR